MTCIYDRTDRLNCKCGPFKGVEVTFSVTMDVTVRGSARCASALESVAKPKLIERLTEYDDDLTTTDSEVEWAEIECVRYVNADKI